MKSENYTLREIFLAPLRLQLDSSAAHHDPGIDEVRQKTEKDSSKKLKEACLRDLPKILLPLHSVIRYH
jgi:hypothetical protein